jgi:DNA-directed RNA polymerase subunit D
MAHDERAAEEVEECKTSWLRSRTGVMMEGTSTVKIRVLEKDDVSLRLLIEGSNAAFMNTLRRIVTSEVPTMAIDDVVVIENSSALHDESLAHRIGLIPLKTDLDTYSLPENCTCKSEFGCNLCRVSLVLDVGAEDHSVTVTSHDLKSENPGVVPVTDKVSIAKLAPDQKIRLEAYARLGKGKDHARWQPVSMCAYKYVPEVAVNAKLCDQCGDCVKVCPKNILTKTEGRIEVQNVIECTLCRDCVAACQKNPKAIEVTWDESSFVFSLESTGALPPERILQEGLKVLDGKLNDFLTQAKSETK